MSPQSQIWRAASLTYKAARRIAVAVIGSTVVLVGIAMMVLPGPAFIVIPTGLAILGLEFAWARRWLRTIKRSAKRGLNGLGTLANGRTKRKPAAAEPAAPQPSGLAEEGANQTEKHV